MEYIFGKNAVMELLKSSYEIGEFYMENSPAKKPFFREVLTKMRELKKLIKYNYVTREQLTKMCASPDHQGIAASFGGIKISGIQSYLKEIEKREDVFLFILDCIHDPHNLGAILRSSFSLGVSGCVIFEKRSAKINATVAKTSAGAVFHSKLIMSEGIFDAISSLRNAGFKVLGCEMNAEKNVFDYDLKKGRYAIILSNEGEGLSGKSQSKIDGLVKIPMQADFDSLNVSVTAGIIAYEYARQGIAGK
ncbi:MAG TPA: 23S rRNA (guanosine(2251)-2'-O)-methyltransferase RlmB [Candidatus Wallbacteria bacterium]|nr:23S rRNA (guanosine(2251)-2'-O)-methyltransferase RlmB [Candidatus Wallbacteria bacterium]HOT75056.1 23S rRNA (guanosine(2251)-2'-O)-methyltransferase RlmB [Candidatus Wallbacteria bacterium]HPG56743.1 23S rRNA (guanosine(2251)-2'-O)-methyltransferase RlmB [Candidatus Wallbacteria bacterium]